MKEELSLLDYLKSVLDPRVRAVPLRELLEEGEHALKQDDDRAAEIGFATVRDAPARQAPERPTPAAPMETDAPAGVLDLKLAQSPTNARPRQQVPWKHQRLTRNRSRCPGVRSWRYFWP